MIPAIPRETAKSPLHRGLGLALALLCTTGLTSAQGDEDRRVTAITNARLLTISGDVIESGTLLVRDGEITALGKDVEVPAGADVVDAQGGTVMPGLVSAWSRAGLSNRSSAPTQVFSRRGRRMRFGNRGSSSGGRASNKAASKVAAGLYARQRVFGELLNEGITTLALTPNGGGFPGQGAILDPSAKTETDLIVDDAVFVYVRPTLGTANKKVVTDSLKKAKEALEASKKPKAAEPKKPAPAKTEKKAEKKPEPKKETPPKPAPKPSPKPTPKPTPKPAPAKDAKQGAKPAAKKPAAKKPARKVDANTKTLADMLDGKKTAFLEVGTAQSLVHWLDAIGEVELKEPVLVVPSYDSRAGRIDEHIETLQKKIKPRSILLPLELTRPSYSQAMVNPAATLAEAKFKVGFVLGDSKTQVRRVFAKLIELVRSGLDREVALRGITLEPARMLGADEEVGSLAVGKRADLLLFDGDPLDPTVSLKQIWRAGRAVRELTAPTKN